MGTAEMVVYMSISSDIKWSQLFYDTGELQYEGFVKYQENLNDY